METTQTAATLFVFEENLVRLFDRNGEPWFVLADVCKVLEHSNPTVAAGRLDDDEKDGVGITDPMGREQRTTVISESGLYSLILTSRKPAAKRFRRWVTSQVLPAIRKTGRYSTDEAAAEEVTRPRVVMPGHPDFSESVRLVREARLNRGRGAALAIWRMVGLPWTPELEPEAETALAGDEAPDTVARFAIEGIERAPGVVTPANMLWSAYLAFCGRNGLEPVTLTAFGRRFSSLGFVKRKASRVFYLGIRPKREAEDTGTVN